jgi:hypothetical protein
MDVEMSAKGVHQIIMLMKEDIRDLNDSMANFNNQVERIQVEDITLCHSRTTTLEKPNNPANKSLWQLVNQLSRRIEGSGRSDWCSSSRDDWGEGEDWSSWRCPCQ